MGVSVGELNKACLTLSRPDNLRQKVCMDGQSKHQASFLPIRHFRMTSKTIWYRKYFCDLWSSKIFIFLSYCYLFHHKEFVSKSQKGKTPGWFEEDWVHPKTFVFSHVRILLNYSLTSVSSSPWLKCFQLKSKSNLCHTNERCFPKQFWTSVPSSHIYAGDGKRGL